MKYLKYAAILAIAAIILVATLYIAGILAPKAPLKIVKAYCSIDTSDWKIFRVVVLQLENPSESNVTINAVYVNGKRWNKWRPYRLIVKPGKKAYLKIYYPWNGKELKICVETDKGKLETSVKAPVFKSVALTVTNEGSSEVREVVCFDLFFAKGELKEPLIKVIEGESEIPVQVWGITRYDDGSIETAVLSFRISLNPYSSKSYLIVFGEVSTVVAKMPPGVIVKRVEKKYTLISNGVLVVRFNESVEGAVEYSGAIDYFGTKDLNFAKIYRPPNVTLSGLVFWHGMLCSCFEQDGRMYAILMGAKTYIDSEGPFFIVYARKWKLRELGWAYEFYAVSTTEPYLLYRLVIQTTKDLTAGPGAGPGAHGYEFYNPSGMGRMCVPQLAVRNAEFFMIETGDLYYPDWPGVDLWIVHVVAACIDDARGVSIALLSNDPTHSLGYWHIVTKKWPFEFRGTYWGDLIFVAGIHEHMLCYEGQDIRKEPYAVERPVVPRGGIVIRPGVYSWMFRVESIVGKDILSRISSIKSMLDHLKFKASLGG